MTADDERGAASVLVATCLAFLLLTGAALGAVAGLVRAHRMAQSAADLAALAGAAALQRGGDPCAAAARVAAANGSSLGACRVDGAEVRLSVTVLGPRWLGQPADLVAEARAGPARGP